MAFNFGAAPANPGSTSGFTSGGTGAANNAFGGFGGNATSPFATQAGTTNPNAVSNSIAPVEPTATIPPYDVIFPNRSTWYKISDLLSKLGATNGSIDAASLAAQELIYTLNQSQHVGSIANQILHHSGSMLQTGQPDYDLRQRLQQNPTVNLSVAQDDGSFVLEPASLTQSILSEVCSISDDLGISEIAAICLYHQALSSKTPFRSKFVRSYLRSSTNAPKEPPTLSLPWMARELYMAQSPLLLRTSLILLKHRLAEGSDVRGDNPVTEATDALFQLGWIPSLIQSVLNYTTHIESLLAAMYTPSAQATVAATESEAFLWRYHISLEMCYKERLLAAECIFFATYNIQCTEDEVVALVRLLQAMTNSSRVMNPYVDVPDPYEAVLDDGMTGAPWMPPAPQKQEKDPLEWHKQLSVAAWETGQPQLLRCFCIILMANVSSMSDQAILMDRTTHLPNAFGTGNALLQPGSTVGRLTAIHDVLNARVVKSWNRPEVLGLLMASYAILLSASPSSRSSPRASGMSQDGSGDIRKMFRECFKVPMEHKSFSFARFAVLPALHVPASSASEDYAITSLSISDPKEFYLSVLADFSSQYLTIWSTTGERILSRDRWEQHAEELLRLQRTHREQQQNFQGQFFPGRTDSVVLVEAEVDLNTRPDCMDDVFAFASAVCSLGPEFSLKFWTPPNANSGELVPSPALIELERQQREDESLRPTYLSFLAALSVAISTPGHDNVNGADVVYKLLSGGVELQGWRALFQDLRWYICQLDPRQLAPSREPAASSSTGGSTAYYYSQNDGPSDLAGSSGSTSDTSSEVALLGLGENNEFFLLAILALITNVVENSAVARSSIRAIKLPFRNPDTLEVVSQDTTFGILFALASMPLSPEVRGAVFVTIAKLLPMGGVDVLEDPDIRETVASAWKLMDSYHIVPMLMFERYVSTSDPYSLQNTTGISFPPSSTVTVPGKLKQMFIPRDLRYSIVYELEYIESLQGFYPSTEGFLQLLTSLFEAGGNHSLLGQDWRRRTGTAPFIEYVVDYVLPRTTGHFEGIPALPFRSLDDKNRLQLRSLEVVHAVLTRYVVPLPESPVLLPVGHHYASAVKLTHQASSLALTELELGKPIFVQPPEEDFVSTMDDFSSGSVSIAQPEPPNFLPNSQLSDVAATPKASLPRAKSPGFYVLASILSDDGHSLLALTSAPLLDFFREGGSRLDACSMASALYVANPPTFDSARVGAKQRTQHISLLKPLRPGSCYHNIDEQMQGAILVSLRILCATMTREASFIQKAIESPGRMYTVPVLSFSKKSVVPTTHDVQPVSLCERLIDPLVVASLVRLVGVVSVNSDMDTAVASASFGIIAMLITSLPRAQRVDLFSQIEASLGGRSLARAFQTRLEEASTRSLVSAEVNLFRFVFNRMVQELRTKGGSGDFTRLVLGLEVSSLAAGGSVDVLECLVNMLRNITCDLESDGQDLVPLCYEILYRLTAIDKGRDSISDLATGRLRLMDFWRTSIQQTLSCQFSYFCRLHSLSWLLKSAAVELHNLNGFSVTTTVQPFVAPRPAQYKELLHSLFSDSGFLEQALRSLPIEKPTSTATVLVPPDQSAVIKAKVSLIGSPDVVEGYLTLDPSKMMRFYVDEGLQYEEANLLAWTASWNDNIQRNCASAHLSDAIRLVVAACFHSNEMATFSNAERDIVGARMSIRLLECMSLDESLTTTTFLPDVLYTTACRNLALAVRTTTCNENGTVTSILPDSSNYNPGSLITQVIASVGARNITVSNRESELVSHLGCALLPLFMAQPSLSLSDREFRSYFEAAVVLAELIGRKGDRTYTSSEALRPSLARLLHVLETNASPHRLSPACDVLTTATTTRSPIEAIVSLIPLLDSDIAVMLQSFVGLSPHVLSLLLASGIFAMLQKAADVYSKEEAEFLSLQLRDFHDKESLIEAPSFLTGHCELMGALLAAQPFESQRDSAVKVVAILHSYKPTIERLFQRFPRDGNVIYPVLRCLAQATAVMHQRKTDGSQDYLSGSYIESVDLLGRIATFAKRLAENPLPQSMLAPIPIAEPSVGSSSGAVILSQSAASTSWWETQNLSSVGFTSEVIELAQLGMDLLLCSVALVRHTKSVALFDEYALSRMLIRCSDAANRANAELRSPYSRQSTDSDSDTRRSELVKLCTKIYSAIQSLLLISVASFRQVPPPSASFCKRIAFALDHTPLEISNFGTHVVLTADENQLSFVAHLIQVVKNELELQLGGK